jgi:ABC-type Fe3+/spermidine/putrescine transport system ATPase subunit
VIALQDLEVAAGGFAVGPLVLDLEDGSYGVLLGPSGAGKSLVLEAVAGVRGVRAGRVRVGGEDVTEAPPERRRIGLVFQDALLFPHLSVAANIAYGLAREGARRPWRRRRSIAPAVRALAAEVGTEHLLERAPASLSGGERQRVAVARALASRPRALLLDEPLGAVDAEGREALQDTLRRVNREDGITMLHVTHDLAEAFSVGDVCALLIGGRLLQAGAPADVLRRPADEAVARFLGARNLLSATRDPSDPCVALLASGVPLRCAAPLAAASVTVAIRPEDVQLSLGERAADPGSSRLRGRVVRLLPQGGTVLVRVDVPPSLDVLLAAGAAERLGLLPGRKVALDVPVEAVCVLPPA